MIDTHTHLYLPEFEDGGREAVTRALGAGVTHLVFPNVDSATIAPMMELHRSFPETTSVAMGLHPTEVGDDWQQILSEMESMITGGGFVAVGEVGMDLYWDKSRLSDQLAAFAAQLRIAGRYRLPVIIHCREALEETLSVIAEVNPTVPLIFHSFTGTVENVRRIREVCDPMFGINGVVTFKNARELREALPGIGLDHILLETDSPYLAPVPHRGKRNESSYLGNIRNQIASTLGVTPETVDCATEANTRKIFNL